MQDHVLDVVLPSSVLDALAVAVAERLEPDTGFIGADAAAEYLGLSRKAVYGLVQRRGIPFHRPAGRLLFDQRELRAWATGGHLGLATSPVQSNGVRRQSPGTAGTVRGASDQEGSS